MGSSEYTAPKSAVANVTHNVKMLHTMEDERDVVVLVAYDEYDDYIYVYISERL